MKYDTSVIAATIASAMRTPGNSRRIASTAAVERMGDDPAPECKSLADIIIRPCGAIVIRPACLFGDAQYAVNIPFREVALGCTHRAFNVASGLAFFSAVRG